MIGFNIAPPRGFELRPHEACLSQAACPVPLPLLLASGCVRLSARPGPEHAQWGQLVVVSCDATRLPLPTDTAGQHVNPSAFCRAALCERDPFVHVLN